MHSRLADPSVRAEMLAQDEALVMEDSLQGRMVKMMFSNMKFYYPIPQGDGWDYEPTPDESVHAIAEREGRSPFEVSFDIMMENNGRGVIWRGSADVPAWYDDAKENLMHDNMVVSVQRFLSATVATLSRLTQTVAADSRVSPTPAPTWPSCRTAPPPPPCSRTG